MQNTTTILQRQIFSNGEDGSTCLREDSHANRFPLQDEERERMMTAISGRKCCVPSMKSNPLGLLAKTLLESYRWYSPVRTLQWKAIPLYSERITNTRRHTSGMLSKQYVQTLNVRDIPSGRYLFRLVPSVCHTEETGFGLLPTVQTQGLKVCNEQGHTTFMPLELLPTPVALDAGTGRINKSCSKGSKERPTLARMARLKLLPTPKAQDSKGNACKDRGKFNLTDVIANTYREFPTQLPVCGGNDGIPRELDGISFPKWRTESIKAYGNAIVPQVAYEIFKAIQELNVKDYGTK